MYAPKCGMIIVFEHDLWHIYEGAPVFDVYIYKYSFCRVTITPLFMQVRMGITE
jgi:hypothetical protein